MILQKGILIIFVISALFNSCTGKKKEISEPNQHIKVAEQKKGTASSTRNEKEKQTSSINSKDVMADVLLKHKGNVIYLDIWATWCGPCLACMQSSVNLHERFKDEKVRFVYFCVKSKKEDWQSKIKECKIKGDHYLLSDEQYDYLSKKINIEGIPRYILIDKKGKVVNNNALSPGLGGHVNNNLIREINELLEK